MNKTVGMVGEVDANALYTDNAVVSNLTWNYLTAQDKKTNIFEEILAKISNGDMCILHFVF